jgi:hypothetical protein
VGRKNRLFAGGQEGGERSAVILTMITRAQRKTAARAAGRAPDDVRA